MIIGNYLQIEHLNSILKLVKISLSAEITQLFAVWAEVCTGDSSFMLLEVSLKGWILLHGKVATTK